MLLQGKSGLVLGVANKRSIAYACARAASAEGARLIITYQNDRVEKQVRKLADELPGEALALALDVTDPASLDAAFAAVAEHVSPVDFLVHSVAYAKRDELEGRFIETTRDGWNVALDVSAYSLLEVARRVEPLMTDGGSVVTMTYLGAERVFPNYNVMGPAKAALESTVRYLAHDLGPRGVRVNAISAGPIRTLAASGIQGFGQMLDLAREKSPLRRTATPDEVASATLFLLSDLSSAVTGSTVWVDCGYHVMAV